MKVSRAFLSVPTFLTDAVEIAVVMGKQGKNIPIAEAESYVGGYGKFPQQRDRCRE